VKHNRFVVMWDCNGLEAVEQLPDPAETTFALLKGTEPPKPPNIMHWRLRAQFNTQRHYEIYVFDTVKGITAEDIREMFEASPQTAADTIREIGTVFHSDRQTWKAAIV
jgi:hypothetical protein